MATEWSIQDLAKAAGTTSRTLRHYGQLGLLMPSRIGGNGYRYYDQDCLLRLQRILLLREMGLRLAAIADVLDGERDTASALRTHLKWLERERERLGRQISSVRRTLRKTEGGEELMAEEVFDGFDHTQYKDEVIEKWGADAYQRGADWWNSLSDTEKKEHQQRQLDIASDYGRAHAAGKSVDDDDVQAITQRHHDWLAVSVDSVSKCYFIGLGEMYVADPRFGVNYDKHSAGTAEFVRDAMRVYAERNLSD